MGGGGGPSGDVRFPPYMERVHAVFLRNQDISDGNFEGNVIGSADEHFNRKSILEVVSEAFTEDNPYDLLEFFDPDDLTQKILDETGELRSQIESLQPFMDTSEAMQRGAADAREQLRPINMRAVGGDAMLLSEEQVEQLKELRFGGEIEDEDEWARHLGRAVQELDTEGVLEEVDIGTLVTEAQTGALSLFNQALDNRDTGFVATTSVEDMEGTLQQMAGLPKDVDFSAVFADANAEVQEVFEKAMEAAVEFAQTEVVQELVESYEEQQSYQRQRRIARFSGQMASIGAVQSSAFVLGQALIYAQEQQDTGQFQAQLQLQVQQQGVGPFFQAFGQLLQASLQTRFANKESEDTMRLQALQTTASLVTARLQYEQALLAIHSQLFGIDLPQRLQAEVQNKTSREGLIAQASEAMVNMLLAKAQYEQTFMGLQQDTFGQALRAKAQASIVDKQLQTQTAVQLAQSALQQINLKKELQLQVENLRGEAARLRTVAMDEFKGAEIDREVQKALWEITILGRSAQILGVMSGTGQAIPEKPSRIQSALGGAFGGASAGAAAGPPGIIAGGIIGGVGGLFA